MTLIYRRPHGISGDGDKVAVPLYALGDDILEDSTAIAGPTASQGTYTLAANLSDGDTVLIGEDIDGSYVVRTYTGKTTLTASTTENEFLIDGSTASNTIDNLIACINNTGTAGTDYGSETPKHISVSAAVGAGDTMVVTSRRPGAEGDNITTTEVGANSSWDAATLGTTTAGVDGDVLVTIDGGKVFALVNAPTTVNGSREFVPDELELAGKNARYKIEDLTGPKAFADEILMIETTDHPSANHPDGALFAGTATSVTSSTLVAEASEDGISHPLSADANTAASLVIFIESATTGAGQSVQVLSFIHATRTFTLLNNWPLTPTGTIVYKVYSAGRVSSHVTGVTSGTLNAELFQRVFSADWNTDTFEVLFEALCAAAFGPTSGAGTATEIFQSPANSTTEVTVTNDGTNRTGTTVA